MHKIAPATNCSYLVMVNVRPKKEKIWSESKCSSRLGPYLLI
jgi:hypothetical protein